MGASLGQQRLGLAYDLHPGIDLGPQDTINDWSAPVALAGASKPHGWLRGRQGRIGGGSVCLLVAEDVSASEALADAAFVVETGLLGEGYSLRCLQRPLDYVRVTSPQQDNFIVGQYDGTQRFRSDATFTFRRGELGPMGGDESEQWLCLMLTMRPGLYAHMEKDGQVTAKPYSYLEREAFHFKAVSCHCTSTPTSLLWDVAEPSMGLSEMAPGASLAVLPPKEPKAKFVPRFSLPDYDLQDLSHFAVPSVLPRSNAPALCNHFEAVD